MSTLARLSLATAALIFAACGSEPSTSPNRPVEVASIDVTPGTGSLDYAGTLQLAATARDASGNPVTGRSFAWSSDNTNVATVDQAGLVSGVAVGSVAITARTGDQSAVASLQVIEIPVASLGLPPSPVALVLGDSAALSATPRDAGGRALRREVRWLARDEEVATLTVQGLLRTRGPGETQLLASAGQLTDSVIGRVSLLFQEVSAGSQFGCGLTTARLAFCWGRNQSGELGIGEETEPYPKPVAVAERLRFAVVRSGAFHSCGLTEVGLAYCWGDNDSGELGSGVVGTTLRPVAVQGLPVFASISPGVSFTCARTGSGVASCWGANFSGQLGLGAADDEPHPAPAPVATALRFGSLAAGWSHVCGLTADGAGYCWGANTWGQLGDGSSTHRAAPVPVAGGLVWSRIVPMADHTCGITTSGATYCWGTNRAGQLGIGSRDASKHTTPELVTGGLTFVTISLGADNTCGITAAHETYCWGSNRFGQLGSGVAGDSAQAPRRVAGNLAFAALTGRFVSNCGLTVDRLAYCWGAGLDGRLGNGAAANSPVPAKVSSQP
jgi:alpha-tubulin suppressor-like RCC1 family protein